MDLKLTRPDLQQSKLEYSNGYFADMEFPRFTDADREDLFERILGLGDPIVDLPLAVEVNYFRIAADSYAVPVSVKLPGSAVALEKERNFTTAHLDFRGQITSVEQPVPQTLHDSITLPLTQPTVAELTSTPVIQTIQTVLPAGEDRLNLVTFEREVGLFGTYRASLNIPDLGKETQNVAMSSMVLGAEWVPTTQQSDVPQPMVENGKELVPNVTHVFGKEQKIYVYAEAYDALPGQQGQPHVTARVTLFHGNDVVFESKPVTADHFIPRRDRTVTANLEIPLAGLPAGVYTARLSVVDENGHKSGFREAEIRVAPDAQPGVPTAPQSPPLRSYPPSPCF